MEKKLLFLINPRAGKRKSNAPLYEAAEIFCRAGYLLKIYQTAARGDATTYIRDHGSEYDLVVCCGGDGTLNEAVNGLLQLPSPPPLGYIPRGSTNDFAASLEIPGDVTQAAKKIVSGQPRLLDIGRFNQRCFTYVASFGAFTRASYAAPQASKNMLGHSAYILEGIKDLPSLRPYRVSVLADGERIEGDFLFGAVSNSTSLAGIVRLDPQQVTVDDGKFELLLLRHPDTPLGLQSLVAGLLLQDYSSEGIILRHVSQVQVVSPQALDWSLDGERCPGDTTVHIENLHRKLSFMG